MIAYDAILDIDLDFGLVLELRQTEGFLWSGLAIICGIVVHGRYRVLRLYLDLSISLQTEFIFSDPVITNLSGRLSNTPLLCIKGIYRFSFPRISQITTHTRACLSVHFVVKAQIV